MMEGSVSKDQTIKGLLEQYPDGFSVGPGGDISKVIAATSHFYLLAQSHPTPPQNGGYLVVEMIPEGNGNEAACDEI